MVRVIYVGAPGGETVLADQLRAGGLEVTYEPIAQHPDIVRDEVSLVLEVEGLPLGEVRRLVARLQSRFPNCRLSVHDPKLRGR